MSKRAKSKPKSANPIIRAGLSIGCAAAEDDTSLLLSCFEDAGHYAEIRNTRSPKFITKGRTGSGKSALLLKLEAEEENVIRIDPSHLCLQHISNSTILRFLTENDVKIDPFLEIIWKYTFATELLRRRFQLFTPEASRSFVSQVLNSVRPKRKRAIEYLQEFGLDLWPEFEHRVTAVTSRVERDISTELGLDQIGVPLSGRASRARSTEEKGEIQRRIHTVLGTNLLAKLQSVIDFLSDEALADQRKPYYILVDDLDRFHVDDAVRMRLLRALIEIVKKFRTITSVKFCIAIRSDLLEEIFETTRDRGFQEEKYEDNILTLRWSHDQLFRLIEKRIEETFKRQYTKENIKFYDVFSQEVQGVPTREYLLDRTLMRPRDAILS